MQVLLICLVLFFVASELYQWMQGMTLPLPLLIAAGTALAIASNFRSLALSWNDANPPQVARSQPTESLAQPAAPEPAAPALPEPVAQILPPASAVTASRPYAGAQLPQFKAQAQVGEQAQPGDNAKSRGAQSGKAKRQSSDRPLQDGEA